MFVNTPNRLGKGEGERQNVVLGEWERGKLARNDKPYSTSLKRRSFFFRFGRDEGRGGRSEVDWGEVWGAGEALTKRIRPECHQFRRLPEECLMARGFWTEGGKERKSRTKD